MMPTTYHLLDALENITGGDETDLLVAGDGVYRSMRCFGLNIPVPLVLCELRGLCPLASLVFGGGNIASGDGLPISFGPSYHILSRPELPGLDTSRIYQYVIAGNGVFLLAGCPGMEVLLPISAPTSLPGLVQAEPYVTWTHPRVSEAVVGELFDRARNAVDAEGQMLERLFYLTLEGSTWHIHEPEQAQSATSVKALITSEADETAILEGHSHHRMPAYFSATDNRDELVHGGFKVYFVLGRIHEQPQIRTRVCVHGYSLEVPASTFFALPAGVEDCVAAEWERTR